MFRNKSKTGPLILLLFGTGFLAVSVYGVLDRKTSHPARPVQLVKQQFLRDLAELDRLVHDRFLPLAEKENPSDSLKTAFLQCRRVYKKLALFTEYYFPATARLVNGPALAEIEAEDQKLFEAGGFQVIEELLTPPVNPTQRRPLVREIRKLYRELGRFRNLWNDTELTDAHVFDGIRLEIFRIITLGISGFDTPGYQTGISEAAISLGSLRTYLGFYANHRTAEFSDLRTLLLTAEQYCRQHPNFDTFDRATFITAFANPLSTQILAWQKELAIYPFKELRALRPDAATLFDAHAFDPDFYAPGVMLRSNPQKVLLGKKLFSDPILSTSSESLPGKRSCASCHQPDRAFTDGLPKNGSVSVTGSIRRNTPTLLNAALQNGQFYDLRSTTLENQTFDVIHSPDEMHGSLEVAARLFQQDQPYRNDFKRAFPAMTDSIQPIHIQNALAAYERSLISLNSRFDHYMRGVRERNGKPVLSAEERAGFNLFMGKAKCGTCHFLPLFNGTVPPRFTQTESEVIGVPVRPNTRQIDPDPGRYARVPLAPLRYAFKTPTIRNIALTGPYMHNGAFKTLEEVVDFYDQGGGKGLGIPLDHQTLPAEKLNLTAKEKAALIAFMKSLTDQPEP
ncbi:cytochrome-c peroxidase [Larkinella bovis]|uniref:Cytochrome-c peroxidase n=1 Tax=Larkinella bovis TaxID=683041 RepID=A0ABW0I4U4_9BACT